MSNASDFIIENGVLKKYVGRGGEVVIPENVEKIDDYAFRSCYSLTDVVIPDSVTCLGFGVFQACVRLKSVVLPGSISTISHSSFKNCSSLTSLAIPEGVTVIEREAFADCRNLESVTVPSSVTCICDAAFRSCCNLVNVTLSEGLETIKYAAFENCKLSRIAIPAGVKKIDTAAFGFAEYMDAIPIEIADIGALPAVLRPWAAICFAEDGGINTDSRFPGHTKYIKSNAAKLVEQAMKYPSLLELMCREKLIAPKNIEAFLDAVQKTDTPELIAMVLDYQANKLTAKQKERVVKTKERQEEAVFDRMAARLGKVGIDGLNFVVSGDLETFENRKELKAFLESKGAKLLSSLSAKTDYLIMNENQIDGEKKKRAMELGVEIITEETFNDKADRKFVVDVDGTLTAYIGKDADVAIPEYVKRVDYGAFKYNQNLKSVTIPETVERVDLDAFEGCDNLTRLSVTEHTSIYCWFSIPRNFRNLADSNGFVILNNILFMYTGDRAQVIVPDGVKAIWHLAFSSNWGLTDIIIPDSVEEIGISAFQFCRNLESLRVPESIKVICGGAFHGCTKLADQDGFVIVWNALYDYLGSEKDVMIPNGVTAISSKAFHGRDDLRSVRIPAYVIQIASDAFPRKAKTTIHAPAGSYAEIYAKENNIPFVAE